MLAEALYNLSFPGNPVYLSQMSQGVSGLAGLAAPEAYYVDPVARKSEEAPTVFAKHLNYSSINRAIHRGLNRVRTATKRRIGVIFRRQNSTRRARAGKAIVAESEMEGFEGKAMKDPGLLGYFNSSMLDQLSDRYVGTVIENQISVDVAVDSQVIIGDYYTLLSLNPTRADGLSLEAAPLLGEIQRR